MIKRIFLRNITLAGLLICSTAQSVPMPSWAKAPKTIVPVVALAATGVALCRYFYKQNEYGNPPMETLKFFFEGIRPGNKVGTVMPCSRYLGETLVAKLPKNQDGTSRKFLDAGAGTGTVSAEVLKKMGPNDTLDLVELEEPLCQILRKKFKDDKRVTVHHASILDFNPDYQYDGIITTIPFNDPSFDVGFITSIWNKLQALSADGCVVSYVNYCFPPKLIKLCASLGFCKERHANMTEKNASLDALHAKNSLGQAIETRNYPEIRIRYFQFSKADKEAALALKI